MRFISDIEPRPAAYQTTYSIRTSARVCLAQDRRRTEPYSATTAAEKGAAERPNDLRGISCVAIADWYSAM